MADADVGERFRAFLRERNLPVTSQRLAIADLLLHAPGHLSADDVAAQLVEKGHAIGLATVYRTLDLLVASGLVVERDFGEGFRRFEPARDMPHHYHLTCTVCGSVTEFHDDRIEELIRTSARARGFVHSKHRLIIDGTCSRCRGSTTDSDGRLM
jgi:Fur family ferric uptake transcriptional regulator